MVKAMTAMYISAKYSDPYYRRVRKDMAEVYRFIRRANPAMARLLFKRVKRAERMLLEQLYGELVKV